MTRPLALALVAGALLAGTAHASSDPDALKCVTDHNEVGPGGYSVHVKDTVVCIAPIIP